MVAAIGARPLRAVIIDDTSDIRDLLSIVLTRGGIDVVGEAGDGRAGVDLVRAERPDVVILDIAMPVMDGLEALPLIRALVPDAQIIVLSATVCEAVEQVVQQGADLFLPKGTPLKQIVSCVEGAAS